MEPTITKTVQQRGDVSNPYKVLVVTSQAPQPQAFSQEYTKEQLQALIDSLETQKARIQSDIDIYKQGINMLNM
jgi:hypothetical protein